MAKKLPKQKTGPGPGPGPGKEAKRARRRPEEARAIILAAAQEVLSEKGPDAAGLKDVARRAGVSHALVSHYFGTFDQLVEAALEEHVAGVRRGFIERLTELTTAGIDDLLDYYFDALGNPMYGRLAAWAFLSGRLEAADFFPRRKKGMKVIADAIEARYTAEGTPQPFSRDDLELMMVLVSSAGFGYSIGRDVFWESLDHRPGAERDRWFREHLSQLIRRVMLKETDP